MNSIEVSGNYEEFCESIKGHLLPNSILWNCQQWIWLLISLKKTSPIKINMAISITLNEHRKY